MFLLGYGLVELPRELWRRGDYKQYLHRCQYEVHASNELLQKTHASMQKAVARAVLCDTLMKETVAEAGGGTHPLRSELVQVLAVVPEGLQRKATAKPKDIGVKKTLDELDEPDLHKQLVRLHGRLLEAVRAWSKANAKWSNLLNTAFEMEDNIANIRAKGGRFESDVLRPLKHPMAEELRGRALFYWRVYLKRVATRALAVACAAMSVAILLGSVAMMLYSITQVFPISAAAFQPPWKLLHNNAVWA
jgi:hypothetical protein